MEQVVCLSKLCFSWPRTNVCTLDIPEFSVKRGEKVFLKGPSGSGKTTLLGIIGGVLSPQSGQVNIAGTDITALRSYERDRFRADHVGFIFQMFNLIPYLDILENVLLPLSFSKRRSAKLSTAGLNPEREAKRILQDLGLRDEKILLRRVSDLSVGQQQRVAAARALIGGPELVVADEPTSALDAESRAAFLDLLFKECDREGSTLVFVSHDPGLMQHFDRCVVLSEINKVPMSGGSAL